MGLMWINSRAAQYWNFFYFWDILYVAILKNTGNFTRYVHDGVVFRINNTFLHKLYTLTCALQLCYLCYLPFLTMLIYCICIICVADDKI